MGVRRAPLPLQALFCKIVGFERTNRIVIVKN